MTEQTDYCYQQLEPNSKNIWFLIASKKAQKLRKFQIYFLNTVLCNSQIFIKLDY